jgi:putative Mg2+ transporter-C (MgtC) family protein
MHWLAVNWRTLLHSPWEEMALALSAVICGFIIGTERQRREKPAGLRTLGMVCLGAAAFTMAAFALSTTTGEAGHVVAQVISGIGFLGAGVIMHGGSSSLISGTTTAATIWLTAAVGIIVGAGYPPAAIGLSILVRLLLSSISVYEIHLSGTQRDVTVTLDFDSNGGKTRVHLKRIIVDYPERCVVTEWKSHPDGHDRLILQLRLPRHHLREMLDDMAGIPEVKSIHEELGVAKEKFE